MTARAASTTTRRITAQMTTARMTQPSAMRSRQYVSGVATVDGDDAWGLFQACALGDVAAARKLVAKDPRLVNAQFWYRFPIHMAVFAGSRELVQLLLDHGADPGQSTYTYDSWNKLLACASDRGFQPIVALLQRAMHKRFRYSPEFDELKDPLVARDARRTAAVARRRPDLLTASDALGNNAIHWSVITRQLHWVRRFAELGAPIDARRADGQTPLLLAVNGARDYWYRATRGRSHPTLRNTWVIVGALLALGAEYTISAAAAAGDQERVEQLLSEEPALSNRLDSARVSPLSYAAREGHVHIVRLLLDRGANPNQPEEAAPSGRALYEACCGNHLEAAARLLEHGADPNAGVDSSECCLTIGRVMHGARARPLERLLLKYGAQRPPYHMTAADLKQAIRSRDAVTKHEEFADCVLRKRDPELFALYLSSLPPEAERAEFGGGAAWPTDSAYIRRAIERGFDVNQPDWLGRTMLHACAAAADRTAAALLLDAGADVNARDVEFRGTPLAAAVRAYCTLSNAREKERRRRMVEFLLRRGAATNLADDEPWATPLAWAIRLSGAEAAELLRRHGAP